MKESDGFNRCCNVVQLSDPERLFALCVLCYRPHCSRVLYVSIQKQHVDRSDRSDIYVCVYVMVS